MKVYIGLKWLMSRLNIHVLISFCSSGYLSLIFQTRKFFFIKVIIHIVGTSKLSRINVDVSFLASKLNIIFALLTMLSQYPATRLI